MKHIRWHLLSVLLLAAIAAGCGSCQQTTPESQAPSAAKAPANEAPDGGAIAPVTPEKPAAAEKPTARALPTIEGGGQHMGGARVNPEGGEEAEAEAEPEEEADCSVIADADPDFGAPPLSVHFSVEFECTGGGGAPSWDFGDGSPATHEASPTHVYNAAGDFVAKVTVATSDGMTASDEIDISVEEDTDGESGDDAGDTD